MKIGAIVLAAGAGTRMGRPKQFLAIDVDTGERLVDRVVAVASSVASWTGIVIPAGCIWDGEPVDHVVEGGGSRHGSLAVGLRGVPPSIDAVLVHSASHPLASLELCGALLDAVEAGADGAVPLLPAVDVIKRVDASGHLTTVGRETLGSAQAPTAFRRATLDRAFAADGSATEESALVEAAGGTIVAVAGEVQNVHVVDEASLAVARAIDAARDR